MNTLIKKATVVDATSTFNGQIVDILITNGRVAAIGKNLVADVAEIIDINGLHISPGWVDMFCDFADPGFEYRETLQTGAQAAAAGGFTDVCIIPNTQPVVDQKAVVEYIVQSSKSLPVTIHPLGSITRNAEGKELAEMYDMKLSGAIAFSDGVKPLQSAGIIVKALQYIKSFNGVIIQIPDDKSISPGGLMNEGITSTQMGLPGRPKIAEELAVSANIKLAEYAESNLHFTGISTDVSLKMIKEAKQKNIGITCSATPYHIWFCDEDLTQYDSYLKVNPPIRNKKDRKALLKAIVDGVVDCIASHHMPWDKDHKTVEFEYAKNGMINLQTVYAALNTAVAGISQQKIVDLLSINPRKILGLAIPGIEKGSIASFTLFNPHEEWIFHKKHIHSQSKNSPFIYKQFTGKPLGIIHKNKIVLNDY